MVQIISGPKGSGKTKQIIELANEKNSETKGDVVFINDREKYREELDTAIRYVNTEQFYIYSAAVLFGFVNGLIAGNYDIDTIYIDNLLRVTKLQDFDDLEEILEGFKSLSNRYNVDFTLSVTSTEPLPEKYKEYVFA